MHEVFHSVVIAFLMKLTGSAINFIFNIVIARLLGVEGTGLYFMALSITLISSVIGRLGLDNALLRFISIYSANSEWGEVKGVYQLGMKMVIICSGIVSIIIFLASQWIADDIFSQPELKEPLRWMSLSILPFALLNIQAESLKAIKEIKLAMFVQGIGIPLGSLLVIYLLGNSVEVSGVARAYLAGVIMTALLGIFTWKRLMQKNSGNVVKFPFHELWATCKPLLVVAIMNRALLPWAPILLLGIWVSAEDVGVFGAATRVSLLVSFILVSINSVLVPRYAELYAKEDLVALARIVKRASLLSAIFASPIFIIIFLETQKIMLLFGESFALGSNILIVLTIGQLINVFCGSVGYLLIISGFQELYRNITMASALLQMLLVVILAPILGGLGAALASSIALIGLNLVAMIGVYQKLGIGTIFGIRGPNEC